MKGVLKVLSANTKNVFDQKGSLQFIIILKNGPQNARSWRPSLTTSESLLNSLLYFYKVFFWKLKDYF